MNFLLRVTRLALLSAVGCTIFQVAVAQTYVVTELATPLQGNSVARGLNNAGSVAGRSGTTFSTQTVAFVSRAGIPFQLIGTLPRGDYSSAFGINDLEQVVGGSNDGTSLRAFLWDPAQGMQQLGSLPGDNGSQAFAINNRSQVVGYSSGPAGLRAFVWVTPTGMQYLGALPGGRFSEALAISDSGQIVGNSESPAGTRAVLWSTSWGTVNLGVLPGHTESQALGVNNAATVVGTSGTDTQSQAFVWTPASGMAALELLPGGAVSRALAVNNSGQIVGFSTASNHEYRAVMWVNGKVRDLNSAVLPPANVLLLEAHAINDRGQILAYGFRVPFDEDLHEKPGRMFVLTPTNGAGNSATGVPR